MKKALTTVLLSTMVLGGVITASQTAHADQNGKPGGTLHSQGSVKFFKNTDPKPTPDPNPVNPDPDDPTPDPEPGTDGPLSLDYVPDLYFGLNKISEQDETYNAYATKIMSEDGNTVEKYSPIYTQVTDARGVYGGWTLTVAEKDQFKAESGATLGDATTITLKDQTLSGVWENATTPSHTAGTLTLLPNNEIQTVASAKANEGEGTWTSTWGTVSTEQRYTADPEDETADPTLQDAKVDTSVQLTVPGNVKKTAERYVTNLDWTLTETPAQ